MPKARTYTAAPPHVCSALFDPTKSPPRKPYKKTSRTRIRESGSSPTCHVHCVLEDWATPKGSWTQNNVQLNTKISLYFHRDATTKMGLPLTKYS